MAEDNNPEKFRGSFDKDDDDENDSGVLSSKKSKSKSISPPKKTSTTRAKQDSDVDGVVQKKHPIFPRSRADISADKKPEYSQAVEQMAVTDLLKFADKIIIGNLSTKQYFERKRLDEKSLRGIVKTYLRGGDYKKIFWQELLPEIHKKSDSQEKQLDNPKKGQHPAVFLKNVLELNKDTDIESVISISEGKNFIKKNIVPSKKTPKPGKKQVAGGVIVVIVVALILLVLALILNN